MRLADRADNDGRCWPGKNSLGEDCCLSRRVVRENIVALVVAGHVVIEKESTFNEPARYRITPRHPDPEATVVPDSTVAPDSRPLWSQTLGPCSARLYQTPIEPPLNPHLPPAGENGSNGQPQPPAKKRSPAVKAPRKPDPLFEALANACGLKPSEMPPQEQKATAVALAGLRAAAPSLTVDEIQRRASNYPAEWGTPIANAIAKHWTRLGSESPQTEIARLEEELPRHRGNPRAAAFHVDDLTPDIAADFQAKSARLKQLTAKRRTS